MRRLGADRVDVVLHIDAEVAEGPLWDLERSELLWVDIPRGLVHRFRPADGEVTSIDVGQPVSAVAIRTTGGIVVAVRDGFGLLDPDTGQVELVWEVERELTDNRMNDGKCDSEGRFWAGTMALDMSHDAGALYRLGADLRAVRVLEPVSVSNGLGWSPDDRTMYFIDSLTRGVDAFDYEAETGAIRNRRRVIEIAPADGMPDGMVVDAEGFLWVALWDGWAVRRYDPEGSLDLVVELPTAQVTSCAFGGDSMDELFITSATRGLSEQQRREQPLAGGIFRVRPGVKGLPTNRFTG